VTGASPVARTLRSRSTFHKRTSSVCQVIIITDIRPAAEQCLLYHVATPHPPWYTQLHRKCHQFYRILKIPHFYKERALRYVINFVPKLPSYNKYYLLYLNKSGAQLLSVLLLSFEPKFYQN
jgi:hypothetical protein